jgi:transcriptional regulator with XRE-family HTH domain
MMSGELLEVAAVRAACVSGEAREVRRGARLTLAEVGAALGVTAAAVSRWERGERMPRTNTARRLAALLRDLEAGAGP